MTLTAEIISIGDELTSGQRLDTNSQWLSLKLGDLGIKTIFHSTVGDSLRDNIDVFSNAVRRADIVVATGGLGPTADDLTREAIAEAMNKPLEMRPEALAHIETLFAQRKRPMPERNRVQAYFPATSTIIPNPHGTAPGIDLIVENPPGCRVPRSRIFSLPGVPAEMMQMYSQTIEPTLIAELGGGAKRWRYHTIKVFGIGESDVEKRLPNLIERDRVPLVGITVSKATITLRIAALCSSDEEFHALIAPTIAEIEDALGLLVYGTGDVDLHEAVSEQLVSQKQRLGVIELGAGCWIQQFLSSLEAQSSYGLQIARWYPNAEMMQRELLPLSQVPLPQGTNDAEHEVACAHLQPLQHAAQRLLVERDLDVCLAVGCYPSLVTVTSATTIPHADFAMVLARKGKPIHSSAVSIGGHPDVIYHRLAKTGLNFLRLELMKNESR